MLSNNLNHPIGAAGIRIYPHHEVDHGFDKDNAFTSSR
jgi:hypothetical protein